VNDAMLRRALGLRPRARRFVSTCALCMAVGMTGLCLAIPSISFAKKAIDVDTPLDPEEAAELEAEAGVTTTPTTEADPTEEASADGTTEAAPETAPDTATGATTPATSKAVSKPIQKGPVQPEWHGSWKPPKPIPGGWDWVRVSSGEWIKGELLLMRDFDLEFDSDEFGIVTIDWEDVAEILTERPYTVVLQNMRTAYTGTFVVRGDQVSVDVGDTTKTFDRKQLLAITPAEGRELNLWSARVKAGFALRSGNTDQAEITGSMGLARESRNTRVKIDYNGIYGSLSGEKNTNNHRGRSTLDYFLTRDLFLTPADFEVFSDEFQNISYRLTPSAGIGYYLIRHPRLEWEGRLGVGYQHTRVDSVPVTAPGVPGDSKTSDNGAISIGTDFDAELNSRIDLIVSYQFQLITPETDLSNHHSTATLEIELTSAIDLDLDFVFDRIERPQKDSDGDRPDSNDFRITLGLAIEY
jgi:hypothetical protein